MHKERTKSTDILGLELTIALFIFIVLVTSQSDLAHFSSGFLSISTLYGVLLVALIIIFCLAARRGIRHSIAADLLFGVMIILTIYSFVADPGVSVAYLFMSFITIYNIILFSVFLLLLLFLGGFQSYFVYKKRYIIAAALGTAFVIALLLYLYGETVSGGYQINDEVLLSFLGVNATLHGINPYSVSFTQAIYNESANGVFAATVTTTNNVIATMDYPSLFFLSLVPFYLLSQPTLHNLSYIDLPVQFVVFLTVLIVVIITSFDTKKVGPPAYALILFTAAVVYLLPSINVLLMCALLALAYRDLEGKHAWIFLGLAASIQEELWLPVILLIIYSFNTSGRKQGFRNLIGAAAVFLAINSYFIIANPSSFIGSLFDPISSLLLPTSSSVLGYYLLTVFNIPITSLLAVFEMVTILVILLSLYFNRKETIPLLTLITFLFLPHALSSYYTIFAFLFIFSTYLAVKTEKRGYLREKIAENQLVKYLFFLAVIIVVAATFAIIYTGHVGYGKNFNVSITNQSLTQSANRTAIYSATLVYNNVSAPSVSLLIFALANFTVNIHGRFDEHLINSSAQCSNSACMVNPNIITLNRTGTYQIRARIKDMNYTSTYVSAMIYNKSDIYVSHGTG